MQAERDSRVGNVNRGEWAQHGQASPRREAHSLFYSSGGVQLEGARNCSQNAGIAFA